ncbi:MAG: hypothetical protein IKL36_08375, partial [Clostridia bacterium]|nr:hypothetical protein [Clostridia bacterium]
MKRSDRLLKKNREQTNTTPSDRNNNSSTRGKRSDRLLKNPIQEKTVPITFVDGKKTSVLKSATTAAPKVTTSKKDKSYNGVDAEINRREASRSARYSMQPEVRAAEIKRAEARGDTKRASELKKATDIEQWAKEQVNSDFVRSRAQTIYDNEFNAAKARGDQSPAVAAEHAAQGYLDLFRNKPQETKDASYFYRQAEKLQEAASVFNAEDFGIMSERGKAIGANLGGKLPKNEYEKIM